MGNEIIMSTKEQMIAEINSENIFYTSLKSETAEEKKKLFNAQNKADERLADHINKTLAIKDVFVEIVDCVNEDTGEVSQAPRIVLIDDKGVSYACVSVGIFSALKKIFGIFGEPTTWEKPLKINVKQITKGKKQMLTFEVA